jgi:hypothetical protein
MAVSGLSAGNVSIPQTETQQRTHLLRTSFKNLEQSLMTGDLSAAQTAYDAIQLAQQTGAKGASNTAFSELGNALRTGDLSKAKDALGAVHSTVRQGPEPVPQVAPTPPIHHATGTKPVQGTGVPGVVDLKA